MEMLLNIKINKYLFICAKATLKKIRVFYKTYISVQRAQRAMMTMNLIRVFWE